MAKKFKGGLCKIIASLVVLFVVIGGGTWVYLANKFETEVSQKILPALKEKEQYIKLDTETAEINKYFFTVKLKDVVLFPNSKLYITRSQAMKLCYNPLTNKASLSSDGSKIYSGLGDLETYQAKPDSYISFNLAALKSGLENLNIEFRSNNSEIYLSKDDSLINSAKKAGFKLNSKKNDKDQYNIELEVLYNDYAVNTKSDYFEHMMVEMGYSPSLSKVIADALKYMVMPGKDAYKVSYKFKLDSNFIEDFLEKHELQDPRIFEKIIKYTLENMNFRQANYLASVEETFKAGDFSSYGYSFVENDGRDLVVDYKIKINNKTSKNTRTEFVQYTSNFLDSLQAGMKNSPELKSEMQDFAKFDVSGLLKEIADSNKFYMDFKFKQNVEDFTNYDFDHSLEIVLDDFSFDAEGKMKDFVYKGEVKMHTPKIMIDGITGFYERGIKPMLSKLDDNAKSRYVAYYDQFFTNAKENGMGAMAAFHKGDKLEDDDSLKAKLVLDFSSETKNPKEAFKLNDKDFFDLMTDKGLLKFLMGMPEKETQE